MSLVDNWLILTGLPLDCDPVKDLPDCVIDLNRRLSETRPPHEFKRVDHLAGGPKAIECDAFMMATNAFDFSEVLDAIINTAWDKDTVIQVLYSGQEDHRWRIILEIDPPPGSYRPGVASSN